MSATQCSHVDTVKMTGFYHTIISNVNRERSETEKPSSEWQLSGCWMDLWIVDARVHRSIARLFQGDKKVPETQATVCYNNKGLTSLNTQLIKP